VTKVKSLVLAAAIAAMSAAVAATIAGLAHAASDKVTYELSKECSKSAKQMFARIHGSSPLVHSSFENHYNPNRNACYMLVKIEYSTSEPLNIFELWDVNENRQIDGIHCSTWIADYSQPELVAAAHACQIGDFPGIAAGPLARILGPETKRFAGNLVTYMERDKF